MTFTHNHTLIALLIIAISLISITSITPKVRNLVIIPTPIVTNAAVQNQQPCSRCSGPRPKPQPQPTQSLGANCQVWIYAGQNDPYCQVCLPGFKLHSSKRMCIPGVYYCRSYSKINDTICTGCVDGYLLSTADNFCYRTVAQCLWFNYITNTCVKCADGYYLKDNICSLRPCGSGYYLNSVGICTKGNKPNCLEYYSPSGQCQICQNKFSLTKELACISEPTCDPANDKYFYVLRFGKCQAVSVGCVYIMDAGCGACQLPYILVDGECRLQAVDDVKKEVNGQV